MNVKHAWKHRALIQQPLILSFYFNPHGKINAIPVGDICMCKYEDFMKRDTWATVSLWHGDGKMHADQPVQRGLLTKCCQKCCVEKHVDLPASQWVYGTSKQRINETVEVVERHANFQSVNVSRGEAIRRKCHLIGWQWIKGKPERQQQAYSKLVIGQDNYWH